MPKEEFKPHSGPSVTIEGVGVIYKNFMGQKGQYNEEGERSFNLLIEDPGIAEALLEDGFNLKPFLDEDDNITAHHMQVRVNYKGRPPRITRVTQNGRRQTALDAKTVGMLDSVTITEVDITMGTWIWREEPLPNRTAYCNVMFVHVEEDPLDAKYSALLEGSYFEE
jgi:hypothetical protein